MGSLIPPDTTQPSNFDLALCIILLRSQPVSLSTTEYIHLLRSLTVVRPQGERENDHGDSRDCRTVTIQHRRLDANRRWNKLLENAEETIMELRLKVVEMEKEKNAVQARLKSLEKNSNNDTETGHPGKKRKGNKGLLAGDTPPLEETPKRWSGVLRNEPKLPNPSNEVGDLALWTQVAPKLLVSLKLLRYATEPRLVSVTIQQICGMLSSLTHGFCEGCMSSGQSGGLGSSRLGQSRITTGLVSLLQSSTAMIISALDKMYFSEPPRQPAQASSDGSDDNHVSLALYAFIRLLDDISSSIHTNSVSLFDYVLRHSRNGIAQSIEATIKEQSTPAEPEPHLPVPDVREGLTEFLLQTLDSLNSDVKHHQDITEALTFKLTTSIASLVIAFDSNTASEPEAARPPVKKGKRKVEPALTHQPPDPETQRQLAELAAEETSWFLLEILHCSLSKYSGILDSQVPDESVPLEPFGGSDGPAAAEDSIFRAHDQDPRHGQRLVDRAKAKLRDAFLETVSSPLPRKETVPPEKSTPLMGNNMRLTSLPVVYEVWQMIGFEN